MCDIYKVYFLWYNVLFEGSMVIMEIKELTIQTFLEFTKNSPLKNYMQSEEYARFMGENKYNYDYVGLVNQDNVIVAASLILWKKIGLNAKYGYAPKGFLINYYDDALVRTFTQKLKAFYAKKNMVFIKINPEIVVSEVNNKTFESRANPNYNLKHNLQSLGFIKLKDNLYFESINPRFNAYVELKNARYENYSKANRNKVNNSKRKGLYLVKGAEDDLEEFCKLFDKNSLSYFKTMFNLFGSKIDLLLVRVSYENFIKNTQNLYEQELDKNGLYNEILHRSHSENDLHTKMASDAKLSTLKNEIVKATDGLRDHEDEVVAGAIVIRYENRAHIIASAFDRNNSYLNANYFLYDAIINNYKDDYEYLDLNGISGDFKKSSPFKGLNKFKLGFNPKVYEYIGEFDLVFNRAAYEGYLASGKLAMEFNKNKK